ncbi:hypothetical protein A2U01_0103764, partial [Trifolium medium]|nr:hypothetical protein [Trifolium medium]
LKLGLKASKEFLGLCDVWMSMECCWEVMFSMMKLTIGGGVLSRDWKLVELLSFGLVSSGSF